MTFESLTAASSKKHVSKRADKHRSGFRTNPLSVFPTLRRFFFLGRGLDNVNFPPRTLISWWTFTQARRATPYLPANRLNEVEREKREKGYSLRFGSTRRFFGRTSHGYGDTFPRVSVDFRQESVDRGTRGYNETQNRINRVYNFGWRKVHLLFLRVWARKGEEIERVDSRGNFIACLTFGGGRGTDRFPLLPLTTIEAKLDRNREAWTDVASRIFPLAIQRIRKILGDILLDVCG